MDGARLRVFSLASILLFVSGALGVSHGLLWLREAALVVGETRIARIAALTTLLLGLALGSAVVGRIARARRRSPLHVYGLFQLGLGVLALATPLSFCLMRACYDAAYPSLAASPDMLFALRFALLCAIFLPPTFLIGGTLPLLLDGLSADRRVVGARAGLLIGVALAGGVAGVLATSYVAIPWLGVTGAGVTAGLADVGLGCIALAAFRSLPALPPRLTQVPPVPLLCAMGLVSGFVSLGFPIAWARAFSLIEIDSVHRTAVLLAVVLAATASGSVAAAAALRMRWSPFRILALSQAAVPLSAMLGLGSWRIAELRFALEGGTLTLELARGAPGAWRFFNETADAIFFAPLFQAALVCFVPALLLGAALPPLVAAGARSADEIGPVAGRLAFWSIVGASVGVVGTGYALLPLLGLRGGFVALAAGSASLAAAAGLRPRAVARDDGFRWHVLVLPAASFLAAAAVSARDDVTLETIRLQQAGRDATRARLSTVVEGPFTTAWILEDGTAMRIGSGAVLLGTVTKDFVSPLAIEGHLPVLFFSGVESPRDCLGLGLGSGQAAGALLRHPIRRLDVVEISGEIVQLFGRLPGAVSNGLARDPRVSIHLDDPRHYLAHAAGGSYDLVAARPPPPIAEGAHALYTVEFYRDVRRVLRPGGVFSQSLPLSFLSPLDVRCVLRSLVEVFPAVFVLTVSSDEFAVLAYPVEPRVPRIALRERILAMEAEWTSRGAAPQRPGPESSFPVASVEGAFARFITGPEDAKRTDAPYLLHDDRPLLSYGTGDRWLTRRYAGPALASLGFAALKRTGFDRLRGILDPSLSDDEVETLTAERVVLLRAFGVSHPRDRERMELALDLAQSASERAERALDLAASYDVELDKEGAFRCAEFAVDALAGDPGRTSTEHLDAARRIVRNRIAVFEETAGRWIERFERRAPGSPLVVAMRSELEAARLRDAELARGYIVP